jgi:hypothetical protein
MFLEDGFSTVISFSESPNVLFKEISVTPPGLDGGGEIDTTTMRNTRWRTRAPKSLITLTEMSFEASYDPEVYVDILDMLNVKQEITVHFPDGSEYTFWGWLNSFEMNELSEGEFPTASCSIIPANQDDQGDESDPVFVPAGGVTTTT